MLHLAGLRPLLYCLCVALFSSLFSLCVVCVCGVLCWCVVRSPIWGDCINSICYGGAVVVCGCGCYGLGVALSVGLWWWGALLSCMVLSLCGADINGGCLWWVGCWWCLGAVLLSLWWGLCGLWAVFLCVFVWLWLKGLIPFLFVCCVALL